MKTIVIPGRILPFFAVAWGLLLSVSSVFAVRDPAPPMPKEVVAAVNGAATSVEAANKAKTQLKAASVAVEKATPTTAKAAAERLEKTQATFETAANAARTRLERVTAIVEKAQMPKLEMDRQRKRLADLEVKLAGILAN